MKTINGLAALLMLSIAFCAIVMPCQATDYKITDSNLKFLTDPTQAQWQQYKASPLQELLLYSSTSKLGISSTLIHPYTYAGIKGTYIGNGQCAVFAQYLCPQVVTTANWVKGRPIATLTNGKLVYDTTIAPGTVIATFTGATGSKTYKGHTAIYGNPTSTGINVWDQNWIAHNTADTIHLVGRHSIQATNVATSGSNYNYANDYCVVAVNPYISKITPSTKTAGTFDLTIEGTNFDSGTVDQIYWGGDGHYVGSGVVQSRTSTKIVVREYMSGATRGNYIVKVKSSDGLISNGKTLTIT